MFDKGYIGVTDREWFEHIKAHGLTDEVNFWRKNTNDFKVLSKGEPFFFLVKNTKGVTGERGVEGFGLYERYEVLTAAQAWEKYKEQNGARDKRQFISQMEELYETSEEETEIGCIIISAIKFFDTPIKLSNMQISFTNSIVSGKGITYQEVGRILNEVEIPKTVVSDIITKGIETEQICFYDDSFPEGKSKLKQHLVKERNPKVIEAAKNNFKKRHKHLYCEICKFDFEEKYGEIGKDYIEGHHLIPVSELKEGDKTKVCDIILVCSNCHRMLHRRRPWLNKKDLRDLIKNSKTT